MLRLFNTFGRKLEPFRTANKKRVTIFTCGPSVYQRAHIGNFRTFLFEDILVRYLEYSGYEVERGMAVTDIEDKTIKEAGKAQNFSEGVDRQEYLRVHQRAGALKNEGASLYAPCIRVRE